LAKSKKLPKKNKKIEEKEINFISSYKNKFEDYLPFKFKVKNNSLEINFKNDDEIENFLEMLQK